MSEGAKPTVLEALSAVMGDVQSVGKTDRNTQQNYSFRGVDAVVNAVGPALRAHGVVVVPVHVEFVTEHYETSRGTPMRDITLTVRFRFYGPAGDYIEAMACGEAADSGDKAVPKAHSVAYRTLLLQALCIPTDEPDPDSESHERKSALTKTGDGGNSGQGSTGDTPAASSPADLAKNNTKEELVQRLNDAVATLRQLKPEGKWREEIVTLSAKLFQRKPTELNKNELATVVAEVQRWVVLAQPANPEEPPFK